MTKRRSFMHWQKASKQSIIKITKRHMIAAATATAPPAKAMTI
jgi:hypothetical protein